MTKKTEEQDTGVERSGAHEPGTLGAIVVAGLEADGHAGLYSPSGVCCCYLSKGDCPCDEPNLDCKAGDIHSESIDVRVIGSPATAVLAVKLPWERVIS